MRVSLFFLFFVFLTGGCNNKYIIEPMQIKNANGYERKVGSQGEGGPLRLEDRRGTPFRLKRDTFFRLTLKEAVMVAGKPRYVIAGNFEKVWLEEERPAAPATADEAIKEHPTTQANPELSSPRTIPEAPATQANPEDPTSQSVQEISITEVVSEAPATQASPEIPVAEVVKEPPAAQANEVSTPLTEKGPLLLKVLTEHGEEISIPLENIQSAKIVVRKNPIAATLSVVGITLYSILSTVVVGGLIGYVVIIT